MVQFVKSEFENNRAFLSACTIGELKKDDINKWNELEYEIIADKRNRAIYDKGYSLFRDLYENTKDLMKKLNN